MRRLNKLEWLVLAINSVGFIGYLVWLSRGSERIFYTQDGVLYLLPCLPFFFVYACLGGRRKEEAGQTTPAAGEEDGRG